VGISALPLEARKPIEAFGRPAAAEEARRTGASGLTENCGGCPDARSSGATISRDGHCYANEDLDLGDLMLSLPFALTLMVLK
jgi:hypothetical protein